MIFKQIAPPYIAENIVWLDLQARVVVPVLGIPNAYVKCIEFGLGFGLSGRIHPGKSVNTLAEGVSDIFHHCLGLRFCLRREIFVCVDLSHRITEHAIDNKHPSLPAWALLRYAGERFAEEVESFFGYCLGWKGGVIFYQVI